MNKVISNISIITGYLILWIVMSMDMQVKSEPVNWNNPPILSDYTQKFRDIELNTTRISSPDGDQIEYPNFIDMQSPGRRIENTFANGADQSSSFRNSKSFNQTMQQSCPPVDCTYGRDVGRDYFTQVVQQLKDVPFSEFAVDALVLWEPHENTRACWNPLATTWKMEFVCDFNSVGVQNYQDQVMGVSASAKTLNQGYYDAIRRMLAYEQFDREALRSALGTWGTCSGSRCDSLLNEWQNLWENYQSGIVIPPPGDVEPPGNDLPWWDQVVNWWRNTQIYKTWIDTVQTYNDLKQFVQDIQDLWQNLQDPAWTAQQILNWLQQLCGFAVLPGAAATLLWVRRKHKNNSGAVSKKDRIT